MQYAWLLLLTVPADLPTTDKEWRNILSGTGYVLAAEVLEPPTPVERPAAWRKAEGVLFACRVRVLEALHHPSTPWIPHFDKKTGIGTVYVWRAGAKAPLPPMLTKGAKCVLLANWHYGSPDDLGTALLSNVVQPHTLELVEKLRELGQRCPPEVR